MTKSSFLHVADVHLDSPLAKVRQLDGSTATQLHRASRRSLEVVVETAIENTVKAVVISGDLFDGPVRDASAGVWVESQFKRLTREGIEVLLIRGNHDALSNAHRVTHWPQGVQEFASENPESRLLESAGIAVHGQSFGARVEKADLAACYPAAVAGYYNVGLLHTSLAGGSSNHDTYAPTSISTLENMGYDYWALGHIHVRTEASLSTKCHVGYSGNTQGRHIRETGAKGCQLVTVADGVLESIRFVATDSIRWHEIELDVAELEYLRDIEDLLESKVCPLIDDAGGRPLAVRLKLVGATSLHAELTRFGTTDRLGEALSVRLKELGSVWLESIKVATTPYFQKSHDDVILPIKYLSQVAEICKTDAVVRDEMHAALEELLRKARSELAEYGWPLTQELQRETELDRLINQAEDMLVARLVGGTPS